MSGMGRELSRRERGKCRGGVSGKGVAKETKGDMGRSREKAASPLSYRKGKGPGNET